MTPNELEKFCKSIEYNRPDRKLHLRQELGLLRCKLEFMTTCSISGKEKVAIAHEQSIDMKYWNERFLIGWIWSHIERAEIHEALEFFKVDGKLWRDPHEGGEPNDT